MKEEGRTMEGRREGRKEGGWKEGERGQGGGR